jgi:hypothetical protein
MKRAYYALVFNADGRCTGCRASMNHAERAEVVADGLSVLDYANEPPLHTNYVLEGDSYREMTQDEIDAELAAAGNE